MAALSASRWWGRLPDARLALGAPFLRFGPGTLSKACHEVVANGEPIARKLEANQFAAPERLAHRLGVAVELIGQLVNSQEVAAHDQSDLRNQPSPSPVLYEGLRITSRTS